MRTKVCPLWQAAIAAYDTKTMKGYCCTCLYMDDNNKNYINDFGGCPYAQKIKLRASKKDTTG